MEEVFSNPGYHYIAQNICKHLNFTSVTNVSKTSKSLLEHSNEVWLKRVKNHQNIQKVLEKAEQNVAKSISDIDVQSLIEFLLYELDPNLIAHLAIPKLMQRSKEYEILLKLLLDILEAIAKHGLKQIHDITEIKDYLKTNANLTKPEKQISKYNIQICKNLLERDISVVKVYGNYVPSQVPSTFRPQLMTILNFAIQMQNQKLILYMLRPLRDYDTCLSSLILALVTPTCRNLYNKEVCYIENIEDFDEIKLLYSKIDQLMHANIVKKFAGKCKNPFSSNNFGTTPIHLAAMFGLIEIVKALVPICNNLNVLNQEQKTALQITEENGYHKIIKLLTPAQWAIY